MTYNAVTASRNLEIDSLMAYFQNSQVIEYVYMIWNANAIVKVIKITVKK